MNIFRIGSSVFDRLNQDKEMIRRQLISGISIKSLFETYGTSSYQFHYNMEKIIGEKEYEDLMRSRDYYMTSYQHYKDVAKRMDFAIDLFKRYTPITNIAKIVPTTPNNIVNALKERLGEEEFNRINSIIEERVENVNHMKLRKMNLFRERSKEIVKQRENEKKINLQKIWKYHFVEHLSIEDIANRLILPVTYVNKVVETIKQSLGK